MHKINMRLIKWLFTAVLFTIAFFLPQGEVRAETFTYDEVKFDTSDAEDFYYKVKAKRKKAIFHNDAVYFVTRGMKAASTSGTKYRTVGKEITIESRDSGIDNMLIQIDEDGEYVKTLKTQESSDNWIYILYRIKYTDIVDVCDLKYSASRMTEMFTSSAIYITIDDIMTTRINGVNSGDVTGEDGKGGITTENPDKLYYLRKSSDLTAIKKIFTSHDFEDYIDIRSDKLANYKLTLNYKNGSKTVKTYTLYRFQTHTIKTFTDVGIAGTNTGYHAAETRWKDENGKKQEHGTTVHATDLNPDVKTKNCTKTLYAQWDPNTYTIKYDANGGDGKLSNTSATYDADVTLRKNTFTKKGCVLKEGAEWCTTRDGNGKTYSSKQVLEKPNLVSTDGGSITLYANWKTDVYKITINQGEGSGGTAAIYEKYGVGFYWDSACTNEIITKKISPSSYPGLAFKGVWQYMNKGGKQLVDGSGAFTSQMTSTTFTSNTTIYSVFETAIYTITFDRQGGSNGTTSGTARYKEVYPDAKAPSRTGFIFKGYYTEKNGGGTQVYDENMKKMLDRYMYLNDIIIYAAWEDNTPPTLSLETVSGWSNKTGGVPITARASDLGSGLVSVEIFRKNENGTETSVASKKNLGGIRTEVVVEYKNSTEGVTNYRAIAIDASGKSVETTCTSYYDSTGPRLFAKVKEVLSSTLQLILSVTDLK